MKLFDSHLEENFANKWGDQARDGWRLIREGEILFQHQKVFIPDFVFVHDSGQRVLMEVVGFWTPEYLAEKTKTLATFKDHHIILVISDSIDWSDSVGNSANPNRNPIIRYKSAIKIAEVLATLSRISESLQINSRPPEKTSRAPVRQPKIPPT